MNTYQEKCEAQYLELQEVKKENEKLKNEIKYISELLSDLTKKNEINENSATSKSLLLHGQGNLITELKAKLEKAIKALDKISVINKANTTVMREMIEQELKTLKEIKGE